MDEKKLRKLQVIERTKVDEPIEKPEKQVHQTNPIARTLMKFHLENSKKFSVKDLFKK